VNPETLLKKYYDPIASTLITVGAFFGTQIAGAAAFGIILLALPGYRGLNGEQINQKFTDNHWLYLLLKAIIEALTVWVIYAFMKRRSISRSDIGIGRFKVEHVGYAFLGYGAVLVLVTATLAIARNILPALDLDQKQDLGITGTTTGSALIPLFFALVILPPLVEEFVMRGFLFTNLRARLSFIWSAIVVSALFGLAHINQSEHGLFWSGAISFFVLSMVLCYLRERTKSLWPSIGVHMLQNGVAFIALYIWKIA
jgi:hypothetical protein